jgi:hypothetical protein
MHAKLLPLSSDCLSRFWSQILSSQRTLITMLSATRLISFDTSLGWMIAVANLLRVTDRVFGMLGMAARAHTFEPVGLSLAAMLAIVADLIAGLAYHGLSQSGVHVR